MRTYRLSVVLSVEIEAADIRDARAELKERLLEPLEEDRRDTGVRIVDRYVGEAREE